MPGKSAEMKDEPVPVGWKKTKHHGAQPAAAAATTTTTTTTKTTTNTGSLSKTTETPRRLADAAFRRHEGDRDATFAGLASHG